MPYDAYDTIEERIAAAHDPYACMECGHDVRRKDSEGEATLHPAAFTIRRFPPKYDGLGTPIVVRVHEDCADSSLLDYIALAENGRNRTDTRRDIEAIARMRAQEDQESADRVATESLNYGSGLVRGAQ